MKPGPTPKASARRQRHGEPKTLGVPGTGTRGAFEQAPEPPAGLSGQVARWWDMFWSSDLAELIRPTDLPSLRRLYELYEDRERVRGQLRSRRRTPKPRKRAGEGHNDYEHRVATWRREQQMTEWLVYDDRGGVKPNPLLRIAHEIEDRITALEDRFALNPAARAKLGLAQMRAQTLAEQNAAQLAAAGDEPEDDPRSVLRVLTTNDESDSKRRGHPAGKGKP